MLVTDLPLVSAEDTPPAFLSVPRCIELRRGIVYGVDTIILWWPSAKVHAAAAAVAWTADTVMIAVESLSSE